MLVTAEVAARLFEDTRRAAFALLCQRMPAPEATALLQDASLQVGCIVEQQQTGFIVPLGAFSRLVAEVGQDFKTDLIWTSAACLALQTAAEEHLIREARNWTTAPGDDDDDQ